jgi:CubicO group peptidase (beta-lactamase class C family)
MPTPGLKPASLSLLILTVGLCSTERLWAQGKAASEPKGSSEALAGIWGAELTLGPFVRGELIVDARSSDWLARIAGFEVVVQRENSAVTFTLPGGNGQFRGSVSRQGKQIAGHWIQRPALYPYNSRYASAVELSEVSPRVWRGEVHPLDQRYSFFLQIDRSANGVLTAFIRNPEANFFRGRTFDVAVKNGSVVLSFKDQRLEGKIEENNQSLLLPVLQDHPPLVFRRLDQETAVGFYPRVPAAARKYRYQVPVADGDGWKVASLADVGLDVNRISQLIEKILSAPPSLSNPVNIQSLLIARHGKLVLEEYFYGFDKNRAHDMRSASKTYSSALVGIARDHGSKLGPDALVYSVFHAYEPFANWDPRKARMKIQDLMNMTTGYYCDDSNDSAPGAEDTMQNQTAQPDWYRYTLDLPMAGDPGGDEAVYCSVDLNLAMGAVRQATGQWIPEFFNAYFARPLQMRSYYINLMPTGEAYGGGGFYVRPRDELKLGQLYLSGGVWSGQRVVSNQWVQDSLVLRSHFKQRMDIDVDHGYGYGWHTRPLHVGARVIRDYYAGGNGGQLVIVIPELDMVVAMNGGDYAEARKFFRWELELLPQYILAAALPKSEP